MIGPAGFMQAPKAPRGVKVTCSCEWCRGLFIARVADRQRGWAKFCSKRCKAMQQEKRTGQYREHREREDADWCHPFSEDSFNQ